ncbi:MAG: MFS transporter, partial [Bacteroidia bacterium]|nr:MFS transporter [Bacteroidia bacterium]
MQQQTNKVSIEFVALMASLMSIVALAIDALLPALSIIGRELKTSVTTDNQLLITMIFLGLGFGQLLFGPLSDSFGRKPIVYFGFIIFLIASIVCIYAETLTIMVVGRILQGIGLSAPRTVSISIIRDSYKGDYMAKIMSFVTVVFILVPIIAPALGKFILNIYSWQAIFYAQLIFAAIIGIWFWKRQKETLKPEFKVKFSSHLFVDGLKELIKFKETIAFTFISGFITGAFLVYLST